MAISMENPLAPTDILKPSKCNTSPADSTLPDAETDAAPSSDSVFMSISRSMAWYLPGSIWGTPASRPSAVTGSSFLHPHRLTAITTAIANAKMRVLRFIGIIPFHI